MPGPLTPCSLYVLIGQMVEWGEWSNGANCHSKSCAWSRRDKRLARAGNFMVARAAFDTSVSLWPNAQIELRQGARVIHKSGDE
jgi:hypothetical protein